MDIIALAFAFLEVEVLLCLILYAILIEILDSMMQLCMHLYAV